MASKADAGSGAVAPDPKAVKPAVQIENERANFKTLLLANPKKLQVRHARGRADLY